MRIFVGRALLLASQDSPGIRIPHAISLFSALISRDMAG